MKEKLEIESLLNEADGQSPVVAQKTYLKVIAHLLLILAFRKNA